MKAVKIFSWGLTLFLAMAASALAQQVETDFDKPVDFAQYKTYTWKKVKVNDQLWEPRIKDAIDSQLAAKGWRRVDDGGDVALVAVGGTRTQRTMDTFYTGFGGVRRRGFGGFGTATTTERDYTQGTLVVNMFSAQDKLIWRGDAAD